MQKIIFYLLMVFCLGGAGVSLGNVNKPHVVHVHAENKAEREGPVNINMADAKTLATLKGIGPKKAQVIVEYRQAHGDFKTVQDLASVKGMGKKTLARILKNNAGRLVV